jgi:aminoglycoside 2''-phosphotransferase
VIDLISRILPVETAEFEGEGDFCRAYTVNGDWIFRFAYNDEGSRALEREAALLPKLAPTLSLPIPNIAHFGRQADNGLAFVGYPKIGGLPLARERLFALDPQHQEQCARDLAGFLSELHSFDIEAALQSGVPRCEYPFCRTEEGIMHGSAANLYNQELERLLGYPALDEDIRRFCARLVGELADGRTEKQLPEALVHGDLSQEHILFDPEGERITGIIDFSDVIISTPLLDFVYLYRAYGKPFVERILGSYRQGAARPTIAAVERLYQWYLVLRLLWALDHDYKPGIETGLRELNLSRTL